MEYSVSERIKVSDTKTNAFQNFGLVVAALGEAVGIRYIKGVENIF